VKKATLTRQNF